MTALRDGDASSGFPVLQEVCEQLTASALTEGEGRLWALAGQLCAQMHGASAARTPERLLSFRDLDRLLASPSAPPEQVDELVSKLAGLLPGTPNRPAENSAPPASGLTTAMDALSRHPAWEDEGVEAAREALASLVGAGDEGLEPAGQADPENVRGATRSSVIRPAAPGDEGPPTPLANVMPRLERVLRLGCQNLDRSCLLQLEGSPSIGRILLKHLIVPLETVIRNALFFGVAPERPTDAAMTLRMREADGVRQLELETDGVSPDLARIALEALHEGMEPGSTTGIELLLDESRSTADHATRLRGYGAGLLEARQTLADLGALLNVELPRDAGLRFTIALPPRSPATGTT